MTALRRDGPATISRCYYPRGDPPKANTANVIYETSLSGKIDKHDAVVSVSHAQQGAGGMPFILLAAY